MYRNSLRLLLATMLLTLVSIPLMAQDAPKPPPGMAAYVVGFYVRGSGHTDEPSADVEKLQAAHLAHLREMAQSGKLVAAGPTLDGGEVIGVMIFADVTMEEAAALAHSDPGVKSGRLDVQLHPWWGPEGIGVRYAEMAKEKPLEQMAMTQYQFGLLRKGPIWTAQESPELAKLQEAHLAHIRDMAKSGKLIAAGPFLDDGDLRGIFLFDATPDEARALAAEDPMIKIDRLRLDLHPWMVAEGVIPVAGSR